MQIILIADIGGTNARFEIISGDEIIANAKYKAAEFPNLIEAIQHFLTHEAAGAKPQIGMFAIAAPIESDHIHFTNSPWHFNKADVKQALNLTQCEVMNDFKAIAYGVLNIDSASLKILHDAPPKPNKPIAIIGPGTGLGVASLIYDGTKYSAVDGEGGHVTMPAKTTREFEIFNILLNKYHHISAERVCSGKGLENLYGAICTLDKVTPKTNITAEIIAADGLAKTCPVCAEVLELFCAFLGRVAGNLALILKAQGGVYIAGGIPPQWGDYLLRSQFLNEFFAKGRMSDLMQTMPIYMINHPSIAMLGLRQQAHLLVQP